MKHEQRSIQQRRSTRLINNTISSLIFQIVFVISGLVLPRLILQSYGSEVNGLVNSITQFLHIITFLEMGVGAVIQSALYKPLADGDTHQISRIMASASKLFKRLARILLVYVIVLMIVYPRIASQNFDHLYSATLIAAMSISSFCQYYFGIVNQLLLTANQRGYIQYHTQTVTLVLNTLACVLLIRVGASIQVVKLVTAFIYLARPIVLKVYVEKHYNIDKKITYTGEPISQKWNGVAQHIASVVLESTSSVVLTVFATLSDVSIYSAYHLVLNGVKTLYMSVTTGMKSLLGELWARQETAELRKTFGWMEWAINFGAVFLFGCTGTLILPFISVYTNGINDAVYYQPLFAVLLTIAQAGHCLRLPYNMMILAAGHYKQTQNSYLFAAALNIVVSVIAVISLGLVGVAIGTMTAMVYQTVWMAIYVHGHILKQPITTFLKQMLTNGICVVAGVVGTSWFTMKNVSYIFWTILAIEHAVIWFVVIWVVNALLYREKVSEVLSTILQRH